MARKKFLIIGGGLQNKGAQAMLFSVVNRLRMSFGRCFIYADIPDYSRKASRAIKKVKMVRLCLATERLGLAKRLRYFIAILLRRNIQEKAPTDFGLLDAVFDISGYAIGSNWPIDVTDRYLFKVESFVGQGVPVYLLPQSFGPFDYKEKGTLDRIKKVFESCRWVFARDQDSLSWLARANVNSNVSLAPDLVLASPFVNLISTGETRWVQSHKPVIIVPSLRVSERVGKKILFQSYEKVALHLSQKGYQILILSHSVEDIELCMELASRLSSLCSVAQIIGDYPCYYLESIIAGASFLIASRYHSIIHGYRNGVLSVIVGWAEKYSSLAEEFGREGDVVLDASDVNAFLRAVANVEKTLAGASAWINGKLASIKSCDWQVQLRSRGDVLFAE